MTVDQPGAHPGKGKRLHDLLHHLSVALAFASLVFIFEHAGLLNWLDSLSLRVVSSLHQQGAFGSEQQQSLPSDPVVVSVSPEMYEREFAQRSPLDRNKLAALIDGLAAARPAVIAIDLDLSPATPMKDDAQAVLDAALLRASDQGIRVVATTPVPVTTDALFDAKYAWMRALCEAGVGFGYPYVPMTQGVTLRMLPLPGSLASQAHVALESGNAAGAGSPCAQAMAGPEASGFLSRDFPVAQAMLPGTTQQPIRVEVLSRIFRTQHTLTATADVATLPSLAGRVVFLGGNFDPQDEFATVLGPTNGLAIHATAFASRETPTSNLQHTWAFVIDLLIGTLAGFAFHATWHRYNQAAAALARAQAPFWRSYLAARGWMLGNLLVLSAFLLVVFAWSGWLLRHDLWNNPGPMLLGVFIKMAIASRVELVADTARHQRAPTARQLDALLWLPVVGLAGYYLSGGH